MNPTDSPWPRLTAAARRATDPRDPTAPYGFATRVAALAFLPERLAVSLLERFSLRALALAGVLVVVSLASNYSTLISAFQDNGAGMDDPVAELVELAS
jgi:hypothetical protein